MATKTKQSAVDTKKKTAVIRVKRQSVRTVPFRKAVIGV